MSELISQTPRLSRRIMLRQASRLAGAVMGFAGFRAEAAAAKIPQDTAGYQAAPNDGQSCAACSHFSGPASCQLVDGAISPTGWCKLFAKRG